MEGMRFLGKWKGFGQVLPNRIEYEELLCIDTFGTPKAKCINWRSNTWKQGGTYDKNPMHTEIGMMKVFPKEQGILGVELMLTHPFGLVEVETGEVSDREMTLQTTHLGRTPSVERPNVVSVRRNFWLEEGVLRYQMFLTTLEKPEFLHLEAELHKEDN
eukprot:CAMPEP_0202439352 /NCGR_PEP_ID=MMETSP1345-20130828/36118_1 /ASSEMBLY_ACC=CAM_ASM_000843 /TAXON_ID=342563 /ORGANISM="Fabrea Fabrea salina" /LENGTH=158 /DNA_ID=CAMNT_0049053879 /DNA_START=343 /DNA_END=819 /DNA_ORIENTATION=+